MISITSTINKCIEITDKLYTLKAIAKYKREMHFLHQKFIRSLSCWQQTDAGIKQTEAYRKCYALPGLLRSLFSAIYKRCRQTDKTTCASKNLK